MAKQFWIRDDSAVAAFTVAQFQRQCERDRQLRHYTTLLREADRYIERLSEREIERDAEAYFLEQQCPAGSNFR